MHIGYARTSTDTQSKSLQAQIEQLKKADVSALTSTRTNPVATRPELNRAGTSSGGSVLQRDYVDRRRTFSTSSRRLTLPEPVSAAWANRSRRSRQRANAHATVGVFAEFEREIIKERVKRTWRTPGPTVGSVAGVTSCPVTSEWSYPLNS